MGTEQTYKVDNRRIILYNIFYYRPFDCLIIASSLLSQGVEVRKAGQPSYPIHLVRLTSLKSRKPIVRILTLFSK